MSAAVATLDLSYGPSVIAAGSSMLALTTVCIILRYYVRLRMLKAFGPDDWLLLVAQLIFIVLCSQVIWNGSVAAQDSPILDKLQPFGATIYSIPVSYLFTQIFIKLALGAFFHRVITRQWQRVLVYVTVIYFTLFSVSFIFVLLFRCGRPTWQKALGLSLSIGRTECIAQVQITRLTWVSVVSNCITDWILAISPIFIILHLRLRRATKIAACALIGVGMLGSIVSVVRIPLTKTGADARSSNADRTDASTGIVIASVVESGLGIIALSLAATRPLMNKLVRGLFSSRDYNSYEADHQDQRLTGRSHRFEDAELAKIDRMDDVDVVDVERHFGSGSVEMTAQTKEKSSSPV